jgi:3-hydroxyacyl-CoA dehydrogenase
MNRTIRKVAVLGSGVMGSRIACHFANIGVQVLLLDIVPSELNEKDATKGLTTVSPKFRNQVVNDALAFSLKSNPSPIYSKALADRITTGNFTDDMSKIADVDWIIEVVVENLDIKKIIYEQVEQHRRAGTLVSSNTSGIPIQLMAAARSDDFNKHFCGTHFFNPPRYLKLLEVIPGPQTDQAVIDFHMEYGEKFLGKTTVLCKDTPAFIANRVGIFGIMDTLRVVKDLNLTVEEVDRLTGPVVGRPKSATFRTMDVVGNDTLIKVAQGLHQGLPKDEKNSVFALPELLQQIEQNKWYGSKSGSGFYKKEKNVKGQSQILALDLNTYEYREQVKAKFATLDMTKTIDKLKDRFKILLNGKDKAADFYRQTYLNLFVYVSNRIPEISDELYRIDDAMRAGFAWEMGPFQIWDAIGINNAKSLMDDLGISSNSWVDEMIAAGNTSFYKVEGGVKKYYDIPSKSYKPVPGLNEFILLDNLREEKVLWSNAGSTIFDLGDGVLNLEFHSKMNSMGGEVIQGINKAITMAEKDYQGLVIANEGANFSAGANLAMLLMFAIEQEYDEIDIMINQFQKTMMRVRYSSIPVVVAPHAMALGGGCEITLHADRVQASAELYTGLVEFGVGLIPAGGGTKELVLRITDRMEPEDIITNSLKNAFLNIGMAKVSTSAQEAFELNIMRRGDGVSVNPDRRIADAKRQVLSMIEAGYTQPTQRKDIKVYGKSILGMFQAGANSMLAGGYISEHDKLISEKLGYVMAGGDLSAPTTVSEQYLLDLEREAFLSLTGERKTLERIQSIVLKGKPLRN